MHSSVRTNSVFITTGIVDSLVQRTTEIVLEQLSWLIMTHVLARAERRPRGNDC